MRRFLATTALILSFPILSQPAVSQDCNASCCFGGFCEPVCKSSCEAEKALHLPVVGPSAVVDQVQKLLTQSCAAAFDVITKGVLLNAGFQSAGDQYIDGYKYILINSGIISQGAFNGVSIRWCNLIKGDGISPDRDIVCLSDKLNRNDWYYMSLVLAHEMVHIDQYRQKGTDNFKCLYSQAFVNCGGCQNEGNTYESDAYNFQKNAKNQLEIYLRNGGWHP